MSDTQSFRKSQAVHGTRAVAISMWRLNGSDRLAVLAGGSNSPSALPVPHGGLNGGSNQYAVMDLISDSSPEEAYDVVSRTVYADFYTSVAITPGLAANASDWSVVHTASDASRNDCSLVLHAGTYLDPVAQLGGDTFGLTRVFNRSGSVAGSKPVGLLDESPLQAGVSLVGVFTTGCFYTSLAIMPPDLGLPRERAGSRARPVSGVVSVFNTGILSTRYLNSATGWFADGFSPNTELIRILAHDSDADLSPGGGFDGYGQYHTGHVDFAVDGWSDRDTMLAITTGRSPMPMNITALTVTLSTP